MRLRCLLLVLLSIPALADEPPLFFEQGTNYEFNDSTINYPVPIGSTRIHVKRPGMAGRLGIRLTEMLFVAADGRYSRPRLRDETRENGGMVNSFNWGPVLGWQFPELRLRLWSGWIAGGSVSKSKGVGGWRMGAALKVAKFTLNFEYQNLRYPDLDSSTELSNQMNRSYVVSARFPFSE